MNWESLKAIYGESVLRFIYGVPSAGQTFDELLASHSDVTNTLLLLSRGIPAEDTTGTAKYMSLSGLSRWIEDQNISIVNLLRITVGHSLPSLPTSSSDKVLDALIVLARDLWPMYLVPPPTATPTLFWTSVSVGMFGNPHSLDLARQIIDDKSLQKLLPGSDKLDPKTATMDLIDKVHAHWINNSGRGGTQQMYHLIGYILNDAFARVLLNHQELTWHRLLKQLPVSLNIMRELAAGNEVTVPRLVGYSGVQVKSPKGYSIGGLKLRPPDQIYDAYFLREVNQLTTVCETTYKLRMESILPWKSGDDTIKLLQKNRSKFEAIQKSAQKDIDIIRFAVLMASPDDQFLSMAERSSFILDPTTAGGSSYTRLVLSYVPIVELDDSLTKQAVQWAKKINDHHPTSLDIGMRRLLQAVSERVEASDGFVDAVIAWENIFGTNQETTFRVTASLAKLIEPTDLVKRGALFAELKKLYGDRSNLVHGNSEPQATKIYEMRNRAIRIAILAFKTLYENRTDLLALKSDKRSSQLLLENKTSI